MGTAETSKLSRKSQIPVNHHRKFAVNHHRKFLLENGWENDPLWNQIAQSAKCTVGVISSTTQEL